MSVQVLDRRMKPMPWPVTKARVARNCRWSWRGLIAAWPCWSRQFFDPTNGLLVAGAINAVGDFRGVMLNSSTTSPPFGTVGSGYLPLGPNSSFVLHYRKRDGTARASGAFGFISTGTGTARVGVHLPWSDGIVYFDFGGVDANHRVTKSGLTFGDDVWAFTTGSRGMEIWQNGILQATNAVTPTRTQTAGVDFALFRHDGTASDNANAGVLLIYNRQLDRHEILALSIDPWTPFRPARRIATKSAPAAAVTRAFVPAFIG